MYERVDAAADAAYEGDVLPYVCGDDDDAGDDDRI